MRNGENQQIRLRSSTGTDGAFRAFCCVLDASARMIGYGDYESANQSDKELLLQAIARASGLEDMTLDEIDISHKTEVVDAIISVNSDIVVSEWGRLVLEADMVRVEETV